jgi:hypothetical protein
MSGASLTSIPIDVSSATPQTVSLAAYRGADQAIIDLWRSGVRVQGEIGRRLGLDQRGVSRRIARMLRQGVWPFGDRPVRGRVQAPVAPGFVAVPIARPARHGPARGRPAMP